MRTTLAALAMALTSSTPSAVDGGGDPPEPVNVIAETGKDVGRCPEGGALSYPPAPYKGAAYFLRRADPTFGGQHDALTRSTAPWLHRLDGPSGANRLFTDADGESAIVFWTCKARDCSSNLAYGAYAPRSGAYALAVREDGGDHSLGSSSPLLQRAIACARALDDRAGQSKQRGSK